MELISEQEKFEELARLKDMKKDLDENIKELQTKILEDYPEGEAPTPVETEFGNLHLSGREGWETKDTLAVIKELGVEVFLKYATISKAKIQKAGGEKSVNKLIEAGALVKQDKIYYYTLKCKVCAKKKAA